MLLVFLFHAWGVTHDRDAAPAGTIGALLSVGNTGVTLFFVLSGFLLTRPWLRAARSPRETAPDLGAYALSRAARILPLYYFMIVVAAIDLGDATLIVPAATFRMLGFDYFPYSVVWWTLVTEMQFYLLLPLAGVLALHSRASRLLLALLAVAWLAWYLLRVVGPEEPLTGFLLTKSVFARLPAFICGAAAAALADTASVQRRLAPAVRGVGALLAAACLLPLLLAVARMTERSAEALWPTYHLWEALCWSILVLALAGGGPAPWRAALVNPAMAVLGKLSYSIYLVHVPVLFYAVYPLRAAGAGFDELLPRVAVASAVTLGISALTYLAVERPFLRLKGRLKP